MQFLFAWLQNVGHKLNVFSNFLVFRNITSYLLVNFQIHRSVHIYQVFSRHAQNYVPLVQFDLLWVNFTQVFDIFQLEKAFLDPLPLRVSDLSMSNLVLPHEVDALLVPIYHDYEVLQDIIKFLLISLQKKHLMLYIQYVLHL